MDKNLVYEKTPAGEEAVRQRTRLVQRNTRMVLILVDGASTVGDLLEKTGNQEMVETALADLEREGLVAVKLAHDSVWEQSRKVAEEIRAAAMNRLARSQTQAPQLSAQPLPNSASTQDLASLSTASFEPFTMAPHSIFEPDPRRGGIVSTLGKAAPAAPAVSSAPSSQPVAPPGPRKQSWLGQLLGSLAERKRARADMLEDSDHDVRPPRRISLAAIVALLVLGPLVVLLATFFLYPYGRHLPAVEAKLGEYLGQPVRIAGIQPAISPRPAIVLEGVEVGGKGTRAASVRMIPEVLSLFQDVPVFSSVKVESARLSDDALLAVPGLLRRLGASDAPVKIQRVEFARLEISVLGLALRDLHASIPLASDLSASSLTLDTHDRSLQLTVPMNQKGPALVADMRGIAWKPVPETKFVFDFVQGQLVWDGKSLMIRSLDLRMLDGSIEGMLLFDGATEHVLSGDVAVKRMSLKRLVEAFGYGTQFDGELSGNLSFASRSTDWSGILGHARGEGAFALQRGAIGGVDLVDVVRRGGQGLQRGGATRFDAGAGRLKLAPEAISISDFSINAGLLKSVGWIELARDGHVGGRLDVEMKGTASTVRMPVALSGTVREPVAGGVR